MQRYEIHKTGLIPTRIKRRIWVLNIEKFTETPKEVGFTIRCITGNCFLWRESGLEKRSYKYFMMLSLLSPNRN